MPAYVVAHVEITDREGFREYENGFAAALEPFRGRVLAADDSSSPVEGDWPSGRAVILEFETAEQAQAWYESDAYQAISKLRRANSDSAIAIVHGR